MIEKIEKKITDFRKKQDPRFIGVFMFAVFGATVLLAMNYINVYIREKQITSDSYNRSMYEIITSVNNIDILVAKLRITTSNSFNIITLSNITKEATTAKENLAALPVNQASIGNVSKYFSQIIGYSQTLTKKLSNGEKLSNSDYENLSKINSVSNSLNKTLQKIYTSLTNGKLKWNKVEKVATDNLNKEKNNLEITNLNSVKDSMEKYEGLIYDGAFSDHIEQAEPKSLSTNEINVEQAAKKVRECVENATKIDIDEIVYNGETEGRITTYNFEVKLKDTNYTIDVDITKRDGKLLLLMSDRSVTKQNISIEEAKKIGDDYLRSLELSDFYATYYQTTDNMITINYAAVLDGVILYPDLIKVKIALDNGEVCSVECTGYIFNHTRRENIVPTITQEQAKSNLIKNMNVEQVRLAIIPTESNDEVLAYEIKGTIENNTFLIYINAHTCKEENVLILLETAGGILTI